VTGRATGHGTPAPGGRGLAAPDGYRWCRGERPDAVWHLLRAAELPPEGARARSVRSVCGLWASVAPGSPGWTEVAERVTPAPDRMCPACLTSVADLQRVLRRAAREATAGQGRLF
jgi:hypothetical protein